MNTLTIGQLAKHAGVNLETIRYSDFALRSKRAHSQPAYPAPFWWICRTYIFYCTKTRRGIQVVKHRLWVKFWNKKVAFSETFRGSAEVFQKRSDTVG
jgi:hypothetical protein